ncbi:MAG: ABC transporter ATP-binding protein/permease [Lachnospiraceae bacterium]|nr:ABC transporter ATP-binding protein/permease [Lachnospiraceae bacterium]
MSEYKESKDNPLHREFGVFGNTKYILKKMAQYQPSLLFLMVLGLVCQSVFSYFWGIFGKYVIDIIETDEGAAAEGRLVKVIVIAGGIAALLTLGNTIANSKWWYRVIFVRMNMITERIAKVLDLKYELLEKPDVLDVAQRASQATNDNQNGVEGMMNLMIRLGESGLTVIVTFVAVTVLDPRLIIVMIVMTVAQYLYMKHIIKVDKREVWDRLSSSWRSRNYMERITQDFDYGKDIRLFNLGDFLTGKFNEINAFFIERNDHHHKLWLRYNFVTAVGGTVIKASIYAALFFAVLKKGLSVGNFTMFLSFSLAFSRGLINFLQRFGDYRKASLETDDFRSFIELDIGDDEKDCIPVPVCDSYEIEFKDVSYRYLKAEKDALSHLNLKIRPGEKLAVVGLNGAGKTTMIKLLLRLYDPTEGQITLNGIDIKRFRRSEYYRLFAPVFQNVEIFAFLMSENIAMQSISDLDRDKALRSACEAGLEERVSSLVKGIDTPLTKIVEDDGVDLSGGEKQKLALAKALYKGAKIVVLDEPTSALDAIAEQALYERFDEMIGDKSAVYISHRLASTRFCDRIAMFEGGRLIECGSHDELMEMNGKYADMFNVQAQYYRENPEGNSDSEDESGVSANA